MSQERDLSTLNGEEDKLLLAIVRTHEVKTGEALDADSLALRFQNAAGGTRHDALSVIERNWAQGGIVNVESRGRAPMFASPKPNRDPAYQP